MKVQFGYGRDVQDHLLKAKIETSGINGWNNFQDTHQLKSVLGHHRAILEQLVEDVYR